MKREKLVAVTITLEEWKALRKKMREKEDADEKSYTVSSYIRSYCIQPHLNGDSSPNVPESDPVTVSPDPPDTFPNSFELDLD